MNIFKYTFLYYAIMAFAAPILADQAPTGRQQMVHDKGAQVMPFNLDATRHIFQQTAKGGVEKVVARDPKSTQQITLIRMHLKREARLFSEGNFSDPAAIHGAGMPGLKELAAGAQRISFRYSELPDGAAITYETADSKLVSAIHDWFTAQTMDHGHDAM
jgi:hypothetical protein